MNSLLRIYSPIESNESSEIFSNWRLNLRSPYAPIEAMKNKGLRNLEKVLNERIKYFLKSKKMTQSNLAEKMDMTSGYLAELLNLNPKKRWNADLIDKAVRALDVPAWQLFAAPEEVIPPQLFELYEKYNRLDPDGKRIVDSILRAPPDESTSPQPKTHIKKG